MNWAEASEFAATNSRREALAAGGLAIAGAIGLGSTLTPSRLVFGANRGTYPQVNQVIPRAIGVRSYYDGENQFPSAWPNRLPGTWMTLSLRPNPDDLLSGKLDDQLNAIILTAPAHSELTFWHENTTGNPLGYPRHVNNPRAALLMQHYGLRLCRGTKVRFGVITCGPSSQQVGWMAPGLDWYGDDLYDFTRLHNPDGTLSQARMYARLNANLDTWRKRSGRRWPEIRICETNSPHDSHRKNWFTWLAQWMAGHNGSRILTYWNADRGLSNKGLSGPWPPSPDVVRRLHRLSVAYQR
ncbi:MAG: hypothetical protein ACR2FU_01860 [Streptosporangiaceae bacterium]